jgi:co-chaperonin GroES (HSP10)
MRTTKGCVLLILPETLDEKGYYEAGGVKIYLPVVHDDRTTHARFAEVAQGEHKGKIAYFHQMCFLNAQSEQNGKALFTHEDVRYMKVSDEDIFFYIDKDHNITMNSEWVLCLMAEDKETEFVDGYGTISGKKTESGILLAEFKADHKKHKKAVVAHVPKGCEVSIGDKVVLDTACERYVEASMTKTLKENYVYVNVNHIIGVCAN